MKIAVDAMGGDNAPEMVVQGAVEAASESGIDVTLVGSKNIIFEKFGSRFPTDHISIHHCEEVVKMDEPP